jgi:hypothetical protein
VTAVLLVGLSALTMSGCGGGETKNAPEVPKGVEKVLERGPMKLTLTTSAESIATAETLVLTLAATLDDGYAVEFPVYPEAAKPQPTTPEASAPAVPAEFTPVGFEDAAPLLREDGKVVRSRTYRLEPFLDGTYTIPSLSVAFWKEVEGADQKSTADTEPVTVKVTSVIATGETPTVMEIAGPLSLENPVPWALYGTLFLLLVLVAGAAYWYIFVRVVPGPPPPPPVPPHVRALEALETIQREKLVEKGMYKEYYIRVSDVLRHYMEEQFQLRAPERTTEEFLAEIQHNAVLGLQEQLLLRAFLRHCDLVKFAKAEPTSEEIRETYQTCEKFIIDSEAAHRAATKAVAQAALTAGA